jgi:hypothetical protein
MNIYLKVVIFSFAMSIKKVAISQRLVCWKSEKVMYDWKLNDYIVFSTTLGYDSVVIDKLHIQIKSKKINLFKRRELSKWSDKTGITTIYETTDNVSKIVAVRVIENFNGVSQIVIMEGLNSDYGTAYKFMESSIRH